MFATSRTSSGDLASLANVTAVAGVDVTQPNGFAGLVEVLPAQPISLLVINAGVLHVDTLGTLDIHQVMEQVRTPTPHMCCIHHQPSFKSTRAGHSMQPLLYTRGFVRAATC